MLHGHILVYMVSHQACFFFPTELGNYIATNVFLCQIFKRHDNSSPLVSIYLYFTFKLQINTSINPYTSLPFLVFSNGAEVHVWNLCIRATPVCYIILISNRHRGAYIVELFDASAVCRHGGACMWWNLEASGLQ